MEGISQGAVALSTWCNSVGGVRAAAAQLGDISASTLSRWCSGQRLPPEAQRAALATRIGVPADAWDRLASPASPPPGSPPPAAAPSAPAAAPPSPRPPTIAELQARLREIPGEIAELRRKVAAGELAVTALEPLRRTLEGEARTARAAVDSAGVATLEEVQAVRELLRQVTQACEGCRARVAAGLRGMTGE